MNLIIEKSASKLLNIDEYETSAEFSERIPPQDEINESQGFINYILVVLRNRLLSDDENIKTEQGEIVTSLIAQFEKVSQNLNSFLYLRTNYRSITARENAQGKRPHKDLSKVIKRAREIWKGDPKLSNSKVAEQIKNEGITEKEYRTIEKWIAPSNPKNKKRNFKM